MIVSIEKRFNSCLDWCEIVRITVSHCDFGKQNYTVELHRDFSILTVNPFLVLDFVLLHIYQIVNLDYWIG